MILNLGSLAFNANLSNGGGTPAWGTELGQGEGYKFAFEDMSDFFTGMVYTSVSDIDQVTCPLGKGGNQRADYDFVIASLFSKVFVNGKRVEGGRFLLLVVKKLRGEHHVGRRTIKYNPRMTYRGETINEDCYRKMASTMGLPADAAWFAHEIFIANQDELHFSAYELGQEPQSYGNNDERRSAFLSRLPKGVASTSPKHLPIPQTSSTLPYLAAIRTKPFLLLAGISGTGKSRIVRKLAQMTVTESLQRTYDETFSTDDFERDRWELHTPANFALIQVKPNWHSSMDVVGYLTNIPSPHYVFTPFVEFIVRAWQHPEVPFFLCLDEMNLAPVEEYFAEFLSAIESRSIERRGGEEVYVTDPIIKPFREFNAEGLKLSRDMVNELLPKIEPADSEAAQRVLKLSRWFLEKGLTLPRNLIVVGTVNMDETTYSFSRKVLDRAMSFEMNEVDYGKFLAGTTDDDLLGVRTALAEHLNPLLTERPIEAREVMGALGEDATRIISYLERVNTLLAGTPFKLGYRAANEAMLYVQAARDMGLGDVATALDGFTLMKILSRLEGDTAKMRLDARDARIARLGYKADDVRDLRDASADRESITLLSCLHRIVSDALAPQEATVTLSSLAKLEAMMDQLARERFVSFWN